MTALTHGHAKGLGYYKATASGVDSAESFAFRRGEQPASPEVKLARAKLLTMFEDLSGEGRAAVSEREKLRNDAYRWFFGDSDFEAWCDMAGVKPSMARERAKDVFENGKTWKNWRAAPGNGKRYAERKRYRKWERR